MRCRERRSCAINEGQGGSITLPPPKKKCMGKTGVLKFEAYSADIPFGCAVLIMCEAEDRREGIGRMHE